MSEIEVDAECIGARRLGNDWHPAARDFNFEKPDGCMIHPTPTPRHLAIFRRSTIQILVSLKATRLPMSG